LKSWAPFPLPFANQDKIWHAKGGQALVGAITKTDAQSILIKKAALLLLKSVHSNKGMWTPDPHQKHGSLEVHKSLPQNRLMIGSVDFGQCIHAPNTHMDQVMYDMWGNKMHTTQYNN